MGPEPQARRVDAASAPLRDAISKLLATGALPVPIVPEVAAEVMRMAADENGDGGRLTALVHRDPALAARILRVANSAAYGAPSPIVSLQHAVARLGLKTLRELAFAASMRGGVFHAPGFDAELRALWRHAIATAAFAKEIARVRRLNVEAAYLCGLLHQIGSAVLLQVGVNEARRLGLSPAQHHAEIVAVSIELAADAGLALATAWKLPAATAAAMVHHADPARAGAFAKDCAIVWIARALAPRGLGGDLDAPLPDGEAEAFSIVNLYRDELERVAQATDGVRAYVESLAS